MSKIVVAQIRTIALFISAFLITSCTTNWPQYRGPEQNLVIPGNKLPDTWGASENIRWTAELDGDGWSSPVIWGNKIFVTSAVPVKVSPPPENQAPPSGGQEEELSFLKDVYRWQVACHDLETGAVLWKKVVREGSPRESKHPATTYASESPVVDGKRLYVLFGNMGLYCYDHEGELLWEKDLGAYATLNDWGTGSSPALYDGKLYVQVDNDVNSFLVALESANGEEVWRVARDEKTNYSTPVIWTNSKGTELVVGGKRARAYDPASGELLWELQIDGYYSIPSAVPGEDMIYLGGAGFRDTPGTLYAVKAGAEGDITPVEGETTSEYLAWYNPDAPTMNPTPLLYKGLLYVLSSRGGTLTCFDAATGEQYYQEKVAGVGACWASPWANDDKIFFYDENGKTSVIEAGKEFTFLHQNELEGKFWASVAAKDDVYILKAVKRLYCIGL